jgi:hypothetical protein
MVKINLLTYLTRELNTLIDKGMSMPLEEARQLCQQKMVLRDLQQKFPFKETYFDLSILRSQPDSEEEIEEAFYDMAISLKDSEVGVADSGLCLLIAYSQEMIQREARKQSL